MENNEDVSFDKIFSDDSEWELLESATNAFMGFNPETEENEEGDQNIEENESTENNNNEHASTFDDILDDEGIETPSEEDNEDEDGELYSYLGNTLAEKGILIRGEDSKFESEEDILNAIESTVKGQIDSWKSSLGEQSLKFIEFVENGGNPQDYITLSAEKDYSSVDLSTDDSKKAVITEFYKEKGFSESKVAKLIEGFEDMDELDSEAEDAKKYFSEKKKEREEALINAQAEARAKAEEKNKDLEDNIQKFITDSKEVRDFPISSKEKKQEIIDYIFKKNVSLTQDDGSVVKVSKYIADKIERNKKDNARIEDIVFDALITKYGSKSIGNKAITDRNRKLADLAKAAKNKSTGSKLSGSGGKQSKSRTNSKVSFDDWHDI